MMTPTAHRWDHINKDNWAAVFYVHISIEMSLPVGSRQKAALFEETRTPRSPVPAISGPTSVPD